jgi:segregation and condensation protein B
MEVHELSPLVEALLFAADEPLTPQALTKAVGEDGITTAEIKKVLEALEENYDLQPRGFQLVKLGNGYQVVTRDRYAPWVESMVTGKRRARLSRAALETAAVIAYKQPITRLDIERIRGVDVGGVIHTLMERSLVMIKGRDPGPGRPLLYGTTQGFLDYFGLARLGDLPRLDEIAAMAKTETPALWDEVELARFEKHGVEGEAIPAPDAEAETETETEEAGPEDLTDDAAEAVDAVDAADLGGVLPDAPEEERAEFRAVAGELAAQELGEGEPDEFEDDEFAAEDTPDDGLGPEA